MSEQKRTGFPGIYHLDPSQRFPNGGWLVRWRSPEGDHHRKTFATKKDAIAFQEATRTDMRRGDYRDDRKGKVLFRIVADEWLGTLDRSIVKPKTRHGYETILDHHLLPSFGNRPIGTITKADVQRFISELDRQPATKRNILRVLSPVMTYALEERLVLVNPCLKVKTGPIGKHRVDPLDEQEIAALVEAIHPHYRTFILTAVYTGMRQGELHALRVKRVDLMKRTVTVAESATQLNGEIIYGTPKTEHSRRTIAIPSFLAELLMVQVAGKDAEDLVFTAPLGGPLRHDVYYRKHFKPAVKTALPKHEGFRFHDLRHTHASMLIAQGVNMKAISARLGHGSIGITMDTYGHLYANHEDEMMAGIEAAYQSAATADADVRELRQAT